MENEITFHRGVMEWIDDNVRERSPFHTENTPTKPLSPHMQVYPDTISTSPRPEVSERCKLNEMKIELTENEHRYSDEILELLQLKVVDGKPYSCPNCSQEFSSQCAFDFHVQQVHNNSNWTCKGSLKPVILMDNNVSAPNDPDDVLTQNSNLMAEQDFIPVPQIVSVPASQVNSLAPFRKTYRCPRCPFTTGVSSCLYKHRKRHAEENTYKCEECGYGYSTPTALTQHKRRMHPGLYNEVNMFKDKEICTVCSESIEVRFMVSHRKTNHPEVKPYYCRLCPYQSACPKSLRNHKETHLQDPERHSCKMCSCTFKTPTALSLHIYRLHPVKIENEPDSPVDSTPLDTEKCKLCSKSIEANWMISHRMLHHPEAKPYYCRVCPYQTSDLKSLQEHSCYVNETEKLSCQKCSSTFKTRADLILHASLLHRTEANNGYISKSGKSSIPSATEDCAVCSKSIPMHLMTSHRRLYHPEVKRYYCRECPYQASCSKSLRRHKQHHLIKNDFSCPNCCASFSRLVDANLHIKNAHPDYPAHLVLPVGIKMKTSEKAKTNGSVVVSVYICVLCSKTFDLESDLRRHLGYHIMSHACPHCPRRFPNETVLKKHLYGAHRNGQTQEQVKGQVSMKSKKGNGTTFRNLKRLQMLNNWKNKKPLGVQAVNMQCPVCDVTVTGKAKLGLHFTLYHPKFEAYKCTECPFKTSKQSLFHAHCIIHRRCEVFKCNHCSASFANLKARAKHEQNVHAEATPELSKNTEKSLRPRRAAAHPIGYYKMTDTLDQTEEKLLPEEFECTICDVVSSTRSGFEHHFVTFHPTEKPYTCSECPFKSSQYVSFMTHRRLHTEENPISCDYCSARFVNNIQKTKHIRTVHKDELTNSSEAYKSIENDLVNTA